MTLLRTPVTALDHDLSSAASEAAVGILEAALLAVDPAQAVRRSVSRRGRVLNVGPRRYDLDSFEHVYVVGAGKASASMAVAVEDILGERISGGYVNVKDGYTAPTQSIVLHEAAHPLPDQRGVAGSKQIAALLRSTGPQDLVLCLLSGGGSALMTLPVEGVSLSELESLTQTLLRCGATINEINAIRKHVSQLKGGRLAVLAQPAQVVSLLVSDVIGNPLDVIASGPTSPDPTTYAQAHAVLEKYDLVPQAPRAVLQHLQQGVDGQIPETAKEGDAVFQRTQNLIVASNEHAAQAALKQATQAGLNALLLSTFVEGEAREVAKVLASLAREIAHSGHPVPRPACIIAGGETTVTVRGDGLGGRNQELALAAAPYLADLENVALVALGTDGTDGPTDAAGAIATGATIRRAERRGLCATSSLVENDSYHFFQAIGDLIITGPTNTNVNDLVCVFAF